MVNLTIDKLPVSVKEGTTLMEAAESIGIHIPHLCYWKGLNEIAACRVCVVELEGRDHCLQYKGRRRNGHLYQQSESTLRPPSERTADLVPA